MIYPQAQDLKEYYDTAQGRIVQRLLRQSLRRLLPETKGLRVLGYGYALPLLRSCLGEAETVTALMPQPMGAVYWPEESGSCVSLVEEIEWPIETNSVDVLICLHGFSGHESLQIFLDEAWRVLKGQGRLIFVVPNRAGIWARFDGTPFGHGEPFSAQQVRRIFKEHLFVTERVERALFMPPTTSRLFLSTAPVWEKLGHRFLNAFGGVLMAEASKQLYAGTAVPIASKARAEKRRRILTSARPVSSHWRRR
jgi:SAM-dependent methyltransferase